ncbi:MAG: B12-binding domain-containing radical SAM protein [Saprospiraceae bacterium]|nr:B12-binding domain-containing radical SAM protein [Saprospiraceae bacterium]
MRVLLTTLNAKYIHTNLAIRLLHALNREDFPGLDWCEFTIKQDRDEVARTCAEYDVVAFSCYIWNITQTLDAARRIKALRPEVQILLGGPEVSSEWEAVIAKPEVDYIITGEGEIPFRAFLEQYPNIGTVKNLIWKDALGEPQYFAETQIFPLENYRYVLPYDLDAPDDLRPKVLYIETSRGCPYKCEFCLASLDNKVRYLPMEQIEANLLQLMQHGRVIKFLDRTFNIKKDFTLHIFRFILANYRPGNVFQFEITADILHPEIIEFVKNEVPEGLFRFEIGIQTVNQKANLEVSRKQSFDKTRNIIRALQHKVEMHLDLIVGLPLDYFEDIKFSFEEVFKLYPPELQLGFLKFLKGTPVRYKQEQHGFVFDPEPPYQIIRSNYLNEQQLHQITLVEHALEIYWNKHRAERTLRYITEQYSIFDFLLGLGEHFEQSCDLHRFDLNDVYRIIGEYIARNYSNDPYAMSLLALDYFSQYKIKPKDLLNLEIGGEMRKHLNRTTDQSGDKRRFAFLLLPFDYACYQREGILFPGETVVSFAYDGQNSPVFNICMTQPADTPLHA